MINKDQRDKEFAILRKLEHHNVVRVYETVRFSYKDILYHGFTMQWGWDGKGLIK